jgi:acetylornithine/N-succinyldiaminopimelate aminotransferase
VTMAKGLGNGFPIGACLAAGKASALFKPGNHGSTFGGNPLACTTALAVIDTIEQEHLCDRAAHLGQLLVDTFKRELMGNDYVRTVRGHGLMIGIETTQPCPELPLLAKEAGLLINVTSENVIRLLPALTLTDAEALVLADAVVKIVKTWAGDERRRPRSA